MPYTVPSDVKSPSLLCSLNLLCQHHYSNCPDYKRYIDFVYSGRLSFNSLADIPFLSVNVFKTFSLFSVSQKDIYKVFYSSGTSGYPSKIYLDRPTANYQTKVLSELWSDNISPKRLPFLLIDDQSVISSESPNTARKAAILGFNRFASKTKFVSRNSTYCSFSDLEAYFEECSKYETLIIFGFTSFIWNYIHSHSLKEPLSEYFKRIIVLHGGGWKKLQSLNIDSTAFDNDVCSFFSTSFVKSYYGLVEQIGGIFFQCDYGHYHCSDYSDIIIRDPYTFAPLPYQQRGLIQLLSTIPRSYPGHSVLTEDEGTLIGEDDCPCGRLGKYFTIHGRLPSSELRGCSDTSSLS